MAERAYIFIDESGDFNFSPRGTKYFSLTSVATRRPFEFVSSLDTLKNNLIEQGHDIEYFHASEDAQPVRNRVFAIVHDHLSVLRIDNLIVEKSKVNPDLRDVLRFYLMMLEYLLKFLIGRPALVDVDELIVVTDTIPVAKKRKAVEKALKLTLARMLPKFPKYRIMHHASKSSYGLQIADYCNWAIYRKWKDGDRRSYDRIEAGIKSELEIFADEATHHY